MPTDRRGAQNRPGNRLAGEQLIVRQPKRKVSKPVRQTESAPVPAPLDVPAILRGAIRIARRPAGPERRNGILRVLFEHSPDKRQLLRLAKDLPTASWSLRTDHCGEYHELCIGREFHLLCVERIRNHPRKLQRFCEALIRHEAAHGMFTDHLAECERACQEKGVHWRMLNVFEDARIEHLERERSRDPDTGELWRFHWWCFLPVPRTTDLPGSYFHSLINREASSWARFGAGAPRWLGRPGVELRVRDHYYRQAIQARRTLELIPLCLEWMSEFPRPKPSSNPQPQS